MSLVSKLGTSHVSSPKTGVCEIITVMHFNKFTIIFSSVVLHYTCSIPIQIKVRRKVTYFSYWIPCRRIIVYVTVDGSKHYQYYRSLN